MKSLTEWVVVATTFSCTLCVENVNSASTAKAWSFDWRSRRAWALLAVNVLLLSPILAYEMRWRDGGPDRSFLFVGPVTLLWLGLLHFACRRPRALHLALFPFYLLVAADDYVIWRYDTRLASSMLLVIAENTADTREYLASHWPELALTLIVFLGLYAVGLACMGSMQWTRQPRWVAVLMSALLGLSTFVGFKVAGVGFDERGRLYGLVGLATLDRSVPFGVLSQAWVAHTVYQSSLDAAGASKNFEFHAARIGAADAAEPELYVLVIGESSRRDHWSLYGYERDTTPGLRQLSGVVPFENVVTQAALTQVAVPLILTRGIVSEPERAKRERSVTSALSEAGFSTYWLSTQHRDPFTGAINRYSAEAETQRYYERRYDGVLADAMRDIVLEDASERPKQFVVLHTMGNHYTFTSRYPREFARYPDDDPALTSRERMINAYDNTVLYMDHVLTEIIETLQARGGLSAVMYVSDHGENLRDDERDLFGHLVLTQYDLSVPMFVWTSTAYAARYPERVAAARANAERPVNTRSMFYSLLDLAGTAVPDPLQASLSVLREGFQTPARMVKGPEGTFDYDQWRAQGGR